MLDQYFARAFFSNRNKSLSVTNSVIQSGEPSIISQRQRAIKALLNLDCSDQLPLRVKDVPLDCETNDYKLMQTRNDFKARHASIVNTKGVLALDLGFSHNFPGGDTSTGSSVLVSQRNKARKQYETTNRYLNSNRGRVFDGRSQSIHVQGTTSSR